VLNFYRGVIPRDRSFATVIRSVLLSPYVWKFHFYDWKAKVFTSNEIDDDGFLRADYFVSLEVDDSFTYSSDVNGDNGLENLRMWNAYLHDRLRTGSVRVVAMEEFADLGATAVVYANVSSDSMGTTGPSLPQFVPPLKI
jgi:hypothetical protein